MEKNQGLSNGRRGPGMRIARKTRITICLDNEIIDSFRVKAQQAGSGYQTMINEGLKQFLASDNRPVDQRVLRRILREELKKCNLQGD